MVIARILTPVVSARKDIGLVFGGAVATAVAAQISIPFQPVPFTLQTFAVMSLGLALGLRRAVSAQVLYLAAGAAGLPVFATWTSGLGILLGKTGGYLFSFLVVSALLGCCSDRGLDRKIWSCAVALLLAVVVNLGLGTLWLAIFIGLPTAFTFGFAPFVSVEAVKAIGATAIMVGARKIRV